MSQTSTSGHTSQHSGVKLTSRSSDSASATFSALDLMYRRPNGTTGIRATTESTTSAFPANTIDTLTCVFRNLSLKDQKVVLLNVKATALTESFGKPRRDIVSVVQKVTNGSAEHLMSAFANLAVEDKKKGLESIRKSALKKAFKEVGAADKELLTSESSVAPSIISSVTSSAASVDTLTSSLQNVNIGDRNATTTPIQDQTFQVEKPDLAEWQELCRACGVVQIPTTINQCKKELKCKNVVLAELSEAVRTNTVARTFPSLTQLRKYVLSDEGRIASKKETKQNKFLKVMLRELFSSRTH